MQYDPRWEQDQKDEQKEDLLKEKSEKLDKAESVIIVNFQHMIRTSEDLHCYHIERQKARLKANKEYSASRWLQLKSQKSR